MRSIYRQPWRIDVEVRPAVRPPVSIAALVRAVAAALDATDAPRPASIGLILSDDAELAALNAEHMGKTVRPTCCRSRCCPTTRSRLPPGPPTAPG